MAEEGRITVARARRDRIGVALSSGGAASLAQIGILEELTAAGIAIECVAGTSGGAIVGAAFAAGQLSGLREAVCGITRGRLFSTILSPTWPRRAVLDSGPPMEFIRPYVGDQIERLRKVFAAVAVDLETGAEIVFDRGNVLEALRASTAIPGLFSPCRHQGRWLADGALVNPLPVNVARTLGSGFVIAVNVVAAATECGSAWAHGAGAPSEAGSSLLLRLWQRTRGAAERGEGAMASPVQEADEKQLRLFAVLGHASRIVQAHIATVRLRAEPADFLINVPVGDVGVLEFHRATGMIEAGRAAARSALPDLLAALGSHAETRLRRMLRRWAGHRREVVSPVPAALVRAQ